MPEYRLRLPRHRFPGARFDPDVAQVRDPRAAKVLVLGYEARDSDARDFVGDVGWYALRNDTTEYKDGKARFWSDGRYPPFWTIAHRVVYETLKSTVDSPPAASIRAWFDEHALGSPIAFADLSPIHANAGAADPSSVDFERMINHLVAVEEVQRRLNLRPALVLFPRLDRFKRCEGFDRCRLKSAIDDLGECTREIRFFGRGWKRGDTLGEETGKLLRRALPEWE